MIIEKQAIQPSQRDRLAVLEIFPALRWYPQQRSWVCDPHGSDSACYNYPLPVRLEGKLQREALRHALAEIVRRHQVFRSVFGIDGGEVVHRVLESSVVPLEEIDLQSMGEDGKRAQVLQLAVEEAQRPFDLTREPLLRAKLARIGAEEQVLLLTSHHLVCDDWSREILLRELSQIYSAFVNGRPSPLTEITYHYSDYVRQHVNEMQGSQLEACLEFWRERFSDCSDLHYVTPDYPHPGTQSLRGNCEDLAFPSWLDKGIENFSQSNGLSPFMTLVGGLICLLRNYSGVEDVGIGICVANRNQVETEELIGPFSNRLLLRTQIPGTLSVQDMLGRVRDGTWEAYSFQDVPSGQLLESIPIPAKLDCHRIYQVLVAFENAPKHPSEFVGLRASRFAFDRGTSCYDLHIWLRNEDGLKIAIQYNSDLFARETIRRLLADYQGILASLIANPLGLVRDLSSSAPTT